MSGMPPAPPMSGMPSPAVYSELDQFLHQTKLKQQSVLQVNMKALEEHSILQVDMKAPDKLHTSQLLTVGCCNENETCMLETSCTLQSPATRKLSDDITKCIRKGRAPRGTSQQQCNNSANHKYECQSQV